MSLRWGFSQTLQQEHLLSLKSSLLLDCLEIFFSNFFKVEFELVFLIYSSDELENDEQLQDEQEQQFSSLPKKEY